MPDKPECLCEQIEMSYDGHPFVPPNGSIHDRTYTCTCGQRWWQMNSYYNLWSRIDDDATWQNVLEGCPRVVSIGRGRNPSRNLDGDFA